MQVTETVDWNGTAYKGEISVDVSTDDSIESWSSPTSSGSASRSSASIDTRMDASDGRTGVEIDNDLMHKYRIRPSSISSMSTCGWEFLQGIRKPRWFCLKPKVAQRRPNPDLYVDDKSPIELVSDVRKLRRGDHCVIVLNLFRTINPKLDYLHSWLSGYGYFRMFHHFLVLDDVAEIDAHGVPRNEAGVVVEILEYSNTASRFLAEASKKGLIANLLDKAECRRVALIDYGDNQYFYRFHEPDLTPAKREVIVARALDFMKTQPRYHVLFQNCEHTTNLITMKGNHRRSALVEYVFSSLWRHLLHALITLVGLVVTGPCSKWVMQAVACVNVAIIDHHMLGRMHKSKTWNIAKVVFVTIVSFWFIHTALTVVPASRSVVSILVRAWLISNTYWLSETVAWNTIMNLCAVVSHMLNTN